MLTQSALQRQPRSLTAVQPLQFLQPRCSKPQIQPSDCSTPAHTTHSLTLDHTALDALTLEIATRGGIQLGLCLSGAAHAYTGGTSDLCKHRSLSTPVLWAKHTLKGNRPLKPSPWDFCHSKWGAHPTPDRPGIATGQRKFHLTHGTGYTPSSTNHAPYQGDRGQHTLRKDVAGVYIKISPHAKDTGSNTVYTGTLPHKNTPSRPQ